MDSTVPVDGGNLGTVDSPASRLYDAELQHEDELHEAVVDRMHEDCEDEPACRERNLARAAGSAGRKTEPRAERRGEGRVVEDRRTEEIAPIQVCLKPRIDARATGLGDEEVRGPR